MIHRFLSGLEYSLQALPRVTLALNHLDRGAKSILNIKYISLMHIKVFKTIKRGIAFAKY